MLYISNVKTRTVPASLRFFRRFVRSTHFPEKAAPFRMDRGEV